MVHVNTFSKANVAPTPLGDPKHICHRQMWHMHLPRINQPNP